MGKLRYLVPNAVTSISILFGAFALQDTLIGHYRSAAWWVMYCMLTDKVDGFVARALNASSAFGAQMDSFADFFTFGVAPATLLYAFFSTTPSLGWTEGWQRFVLPALCFSLILGNVSRLARFNVTHDVRGGDRFFFGVPTTLIGGFICAIFVTLLKYGDPAWSATDPIGADFYLLGSLRLDSWMPLLPWLMPLFAATMVSKLRVPKVGRTHRPVVDVLQLLNVIGGYGFGLIHRVPEYLTSGGVIYLSISVYYHLTNKAARAAHLPELFPSDRPQSSLPTDDTELRAGLG